MNQWPIISTWAPAVYSEFNVRVVVLVLTSQSLTMLSKDGGWRLYSATRLEKTRYKSPIQRFERQERLNLVIGISAVTWQTGDAQNKDSIPCTILIIRSQ